MKEPMKWTDTQEIADRACGRLSRQGPQGRELRRSLQVGHGLPGFSDDPKRCGERILEAIQQAWIEEAE